MNEILAGLIIMVFVYLLYTLLIIFNKRRLEKFIKKSKECTLIKGRYKVNFDKVNHKMVANIIAINNSVIIGVTFTIMMFVHNFILKLLFSFLIFIVLVIFTYTIIGKYIKSKEEK